MDAQPRQHIVIITGLSGAGRRTAAHTMEDLGWYVVDNLPPVMLPDLARRMRDTNELRIAVVVDVRTRKEFEQLPEAFGRLRSDGVEINMLYLEAGDEVIVQRQESNRRPLPLQGDGTLLDGITRERRLLADLRAGADMVVDTSRITARQLAQRIVNHYGDDVTDSLRVALVSFGFKRGLPVDADMVFDVRFLPNPYWVPELKPLTGLDSEVAGYVLRDPAAENFQEAMVRVIEVATPGYLSEGKRQVTIALGCTGGKHRSTSMSEELANRLRARGYRVSVLHRDLGKE